MFAGFSILLGIFVTANFIIITLPATYIVIELSFTYTMEFIVPVRNGNVSILVPLTT